MLTNTNTTTTTTTTKTDPLPFASNNHDHLMVSLTLFRSDNWRSFRLLENVDMDDVDMYEDELSEVDRTEFSFVSINQSSWGLRRHGEALEPPLREVALGAWPMKS
jgi:hypothetical protein